MDIQSSEVVARKQFGDGVGAYLVITLCSSSAAHRHPTAETGTRECTRRGAHALKTLGRHVPVGLLVVGFVQIHARDEKEILQGKMLSA
jgi:hypothetical protein